MAGYTSFAQFYDRLTENVDYPARAAYFDSLLREYGNGGPLLLDLACGTGSLTRELAALGYDPIGVDGSAEMLSCAMAKNDGPPLLYLCQEMTGLDLYGTVDAAVCALDSLNHLSSPEAVRQSIARVSLFLNPGGIFLFDVNTQYKQAQVLADNAFAYEREDFFCVWQNTWQPPDSTLVQLDFFIPEAGRYRRETECFTERVYSTPFLQECIASAGLTLVGLFEADTRQPPGQEAQRLVFVCRKS